jgi:hypothetical protein
MNLQAYLGSALCRRCANPLLGSPKVATVRPPVWKFGSSLSSAQTAMAGEYCAPSRQIEDGLKYIGETRVTRGVT